jgi:hypothetical protein
MGQERRGPKMSGCDAIVTTDLSGQLEDLDIWGYESEPQEQIALSGADDPQEDRGQGAD